MNSKSIDNTFHELTFNGKLLLKELDSRGIKLQGLGSTYVVKASYRGHDELIYDLQTNLTPYPIGLMIDDKFYSKRLMQKFGFQVAAGMAFSYEEQSRALIFAEKLGYPVVLKPTVGSHGDHVYIKIQSENELKKCIKSSENHKMGNGHFLIERYVEANEYRLFVTSDRFFAAVQRTPASILGDGLSSIQELVNKENFKRMNPRDTCLCEIKIDEIVESLLHLKNLSVKSVPLEGERVFLRQNSNVSTGGNCIEITNSVHSSVIKLAHSIREKLGVSYLGIDLLCDDIGSQLKEYAICELNSAPGLSLHMMPEHGVPQNTASAVADVLFPETKR